MGVRPADNICPGATRSVQLARLIYCNRVCSVIDLSKFVPTKIQDTAASVLVPVPPNGTLCVIYKITVGWKLRGG